MKENAREPTEAIKGPTQWALLILDVTRSLREWRLWIHLGWEDIAKQYRRSFLGPIWISLNTAIFVIAFGMIGAQLFKVPVKEYLPYFCLGHILFGFISAILTEGCLAFISAEAFLKQNPYPKFAFSLRVVWRNILVLFHNFPIAVGVLIWAGRFYEIRVMGFLLALAVAIFTAALLVSLVGALSARFRDVPMIINSIMQISFFITPVMWKSSQVTERAQMLVNFNPLAAFLEIMRSPMLGQPTSPEAWTMVISVNGVLVFLFGTLFLKARRRIVYWI